MEKDTVLYDSPDTRPLPRWLTDQRDGLNAYQPEILEMKDDKSLQISIIITGIIIIAAVILLTVYFVYRNKKRL
jgi:heme/copper-type cytochrome/quinol oxidase subunit 2